VVVNFDGGIMKWPLSDTPNLRKMLEALSPKASTLRTTLECRNIMRHFEKPTISILITSFNALDTNMKISKYQSFDTEQTPKWACRL
jgi:hypothetical protein